MDPMTVIQEIDRHLGARRVTDAKALVDQAAKQFPNSVDIGIRLGRICQIEGNFSGMLGAARGVLAKAPDHPLARLQEAEALIQTGEIDEAVARLSALQSLANDSAALLQHVAELLTKLSLFEQACDCYTRAVELDPDNPGMKYNLATALNFAGRQTEAEALLDDVIARNPSDFRAWHTRSTLRSQTPENNHIEALEKALGSAPAGGKIQLHYALAKELEDTGHWPESFRHLKTGADLRRRAMQYDVAGDVTTMNLIRQRMDSTFCAAVNPETETTRIFVLGLPRSGTTLVDRILASHDSVTSLGEVNDFAMAMMQLAGPVSSKEALIGASTRLDFDALGEVYRRTTAARGTIAPILIDKTPANFLYIGLIARALPDARIVHLRRNPMDSCYAMYKTLFGMGYPFSYDLEDLAEYYAAYSQLMDHWRQCLPGRILDVDYEQLVTSQEAESRRLLDFCGLDWRNDVLSFHETAGVAATASAAQVRRKIHAESVGRWRCFEDELKPLQTALTSRGVLLSGKDTP